MSNQRILRRRANQQPAFYRVHVEERNNLEFFKKKLLSKEKTRLELRKNTNLENLLIFLEFERMKLFKTGLLMLAVVALAVNAEEEFDSGKIFQFSILSYGYNGYDS